MSKRNILDACDTISEAAAFVRALEMTTRDPSGCYADPGDANAVAALCFAAQDKLTASLDLLRQAVEELRQ